ncbi:MAG: hypothetical protein LBP19_05510 [Treponema sp.]|jgi:hypothetical protein|nr:hypothetical protein [Treponema sp.]
MNTVDAPIRACRDGAFYGRDKDGWSKRLMRAFLTTYAPCDREFRMAGLWKDALVYRLLSFML